MTLGDRRHDPMSPSGTKLTCRNAGYESVFEV